MLKSRPLLVRVLLSYLAAALALFPAIGFGAQKTSRRTASASELNAAVAVAQSGDLARAEREFSRLAELYPRDPAVRTGLGQLQVQLGNIKAGISSFQTVLRLDPSSSQAHVNLGIALAAGGDLPGALRQASAALSLAPGSPDAHLLRGRVLADMGKEQEARADLNEVLSVQPESVLALRALWQVDQKLGDTPTLISTLHRYLVLAPQDGEAWLQLGKAYMALGNNSDAVPALRRAVALQPESSEALFALSRALRTEDPEDSRRLAAQIAALRSNQHVADEVHLLGAEGNQALEQGRNPAAIELFTKALKICGDCTDAADLHKNLGLAYSRNGQVAEGEEQFRIARSLRPHDSQK